MTLYQNVNVSASDAEAALRASVEALLNARHSPQRVLRALRIVSDEVECRVLAKRSDLTPVDDIIKAVMAAHGVLSTVELLSASRARPLCWARHHAAWEIRTRRPDVPLSKIGAWLGRLDHSTAWNSLSKFGRAIQEGRYEKERAHVERALSC